MDDPTPDEAAATVERLTQRPKGGVVWSPKELADRALVAGYRELRDEVAALRADLAQAREEVREHRRDVLDVGDLMECVQRDLHAARAREQTVRPVVDEVVAAWRRLNASAWGQGDPFPSDLDSALDRLAALAPATPQEGDNR